MTFLESLGGYWPGVAATHLAECFGDPVGWTYPKVFHQGDFRSWLRAYTLEEGAYNMDRVLEGLDGLIAKGHLVRKGSELQMTPEFVKLMQRHYETVVRRS